MTRVKELKWQCSVQHYCNMRRNCTFSCGVGVISRVGGRRRVSDNQWYRMWTKTSALSPFLGISQCSWPVQAFLTFSHVRHWLTPANFIHRKVGVKHGGHSVNSTGHSFSWNSPKKVKCATLRLTCTWILWQLTSREPLSIHNQDSAVKVNVLTNAKKFTQFSNLKSWTVDHSWNKEICH